jgi:8-oxo-dGTP diphosphatase
MKIIRSAKVVVIDADGKALLLRRSGTHPRYALDADIPGGTIEENETIEAGLVRELQEETGITAAETDLRLLYTMTFDAIPGISINRLLYGLQIDQSSPDVQLSWEHDRFSWVPVAELKGLERPYQTGVDYVNDHGLWSEV